MANKARHLKKPKPLSNDNFMLILESSNGKTTITMVDESSSSCLFFKDEEIKDVKSTSMAGLCKQLVDTVKQQYKAGFSDEPIQESQPNKQ